MRTIKGGRFYRGATIHRDAADADSRTVELSYSSEAEFERSFGIEVLSHEEGAQDMSRLNNGGALLMDHDPTDQVGVVEEAWIGPDRRGHARVRFGKSARAEEVFQDVLDGIRSLVSVGYYVHEMKKTEERAKGEPDVYTVTRYEPLEISIVSIPADVDVGVGRMIDEADMAQRILITNEKEPEKMAEEKTTVVEETPQVDVIKVQEKAIAAERSRVAKIRTIGKHAGADDLAQSFIDNGKSVDAFCDALAERAPSKPEPGPSPEIGLTPKEAREFSFVRAIRAQAFQDRKYKDEAAFEMEVSRAAEQKYGKTAQGIMVPWDVTTRADHLTSTDNVGGYLKGTDHRGDLFIEMLYSSLVLKKAGMTVMDGLLKGDVAIPSQTGKSTFAWLQTEGTSEAAETNVTLGQKTLSPKTACAYSDMTRKLLLQSVPSIERIVKNDLVRSLALAIDYAGIHGDTSVDYGPEGIEQQAQVDVNQAGAAPAYADMLNIMKEVAVDNALTGSLAWITNAKLACRLMGIFINSTGGETPIWKSSPVGGEGSILGYPALISNQVKATYLHTAANDASLLVFGNFADLVLGLWSGVDILVDPYAQATKGTLRVLVFQDCDMCIRHTDSFAISDNLQH